MTVVQESWNFNGRKRGFKGLFDPKNLLRFLRQFFKKDGPMSLTEYLDDISLMMNVVCTANNGQFYVDVSNDISKLDEGDPNPDFYDTITFNGSALPVLASANVVITAAIQLDCFALMRLRFVQGATHTDGTVTCDIIGKGL